MCWKRTLLCIKHTHTHTHTHKLHTYYTIKIRHSRFSRQTAVGTGNSIFNTILNHVKTVYLTHCFIVTHILVICDVHILQLRPQQHSHYSNSLETGQYENRILVEARFSMPVQTGSKGHRSSCTMGTRSFLEVKRQGRGANHPPLVALRMQMSWNYTFSYHLCLHRLVMG